MANTTSSPCAACRGDIGLLQASFTSECSHTFHLRCVSGTAACPVCAAKWSDTPATAPTRSPASPFSFTPHPPQPSAGTFGQPPLPRPRPTQISAPYGGSLFGPKAPRATQNPFWLGTAPTPPQASSCCVCHGAIGRGQATVTSECNHTLHLRCISGSVCPVCSATW